MTIVAHLVSALLLTLVMGVLFWLARNLTTRVARRHNAGANSDVLRGILRSLFGSISSSKAIRLGQSATSAARAHTTSTISFPEYLRSLLSFLACYCTSWASGRCPTSTYMLSIMTLAVVIYDLWILAGAASKINRLTDEFKA